MRQKATVRYRPIEVTVENRPIGGAAYAIRIGLFQKILVRSWSTGHDKSVKKQLKGILIGLGNGGGRFCGSPFPLKVLIDIVVFLF